ncbi:hypothetical protein ISCGN_026362 [Ixodes scapularis]
MGDGKPDAWIPLIHSRKMAPAKNARANKNELLASLVRAKPSIWNQRSMNADLRWSAWKLDLLGGAERIVVSLARSEVCACVSIRSGVRTVGSDDSAVHLSRALGEHQTPLCGHTNGI